MREDAYSKKKKKMIPTNINYVLHTQFVLSANLSTLDNLSRQTKYYNQNYAFSQKKKTSKTLNKEKDALSVFGQNRVLLEAKTSFVLEGNIKF
jgi:hypothetical protein